MEHKSPVAEHFAVWRTPSTALDLWCFRFRAENIWSWNSVGLSLTSINTRWALSNSSNIPSAVVIPFTSKIIWPGLMVTGWIPDISGRTAWNDSTSRTTRPSMAGCAPTDMPNGLPSTRSSQTCWAVLTWVRGSKSWHRDSKKNILQWEVPFEPTDRIRNQLPQLFQVVSILIFTHLSVSAISLLFGIVSNQSLHIGPCFGCSLFRSFHVQHVQSASNISNIPSRANLHQLTQASYGLLKTTSSFQAPTASGATLRRCTCSRSLCLTSVRVNQGRLYATLLEVNKEP